MNLKAYAIFDKLQTTFMTPMFQHNDGTALRMVQQAVNDKESYIYKNPQDYSLYLVGEWDDKGEMKGVENRKVVEMVELVDHDSRVDENQLELFQTELKATRAVVDSLKTLIIGKDQAS